MFSGVRSQNVHLPGIGEVDSSEGAFNADILFGKNQKQVGDKDVPNVSICGLGDLWVDPLAEVIDDPSVKYDFALKNRGGVIVIWLPKKKHG